jgi:hypothetical protein
MTETLRIAAGVATPLGLLGLVVAFGSLIYHRRLKYRIAQIRSLPEADRAKAADNYLSRYGFDAANLTRAQKNELLFKEMERRYQLARLAIITSASVFLVCFVVAAYVYVEVNRLSSNISPVDSPSVRQRTAGSGSPAITGTAGRDLNIAVNMPPNPRPVESQSSEYSLEPRIASKKIDDCIENEDFSGALRYVPFLRTPEDRDSVRKRIFDKLIKSHKLHEAMGVIAQIESGSDRDEAQRRYNHERVKR